MTHGLTIQRPRRAGATAILCWTLSLFGAESVPERWPAPIERALLEAGTNRTALSRARIQCAPNERAGLDFLLEHMPRNDLKTLDADLLLENVSLAYQAMAQAPWRDRIPHDRFLNDVLPYAIASEPRERWRAQLLKLAQPLIADCRTPAEAAHRLNQKLFPLVKVRYSTQRRRADQGPLETMETGIATCTGLSILLADACRAVGVPARIAGIPLWPNKRGNHTWAEIWDGDWHFAGAAEPDEKGLNHGWFQQDASTALPDVREHSIYATSFAQTGLTFPMNWAQENHDVPAVNVTFRYAKGAATIPTHSVRVLVDVRAYPFGPRVVRPVSIVAADGPTPVARASSRGEFADRDDVRGTVYLDQRLIDPSRPVEIEFNGRTCPARTVQPRLRTLAATMARRGDPNLAFTLALEFPFDSPPPER